MVNEDKIILYSTHCPKCKILEKKLKDKGVPYSEINDANEMIKKGFTEVPMLEVDGIPYTFGEAAKWLNNFNVGV